MHFLSSGGLRNSWGVNKHRNAQRSIFRAKAVHAGHRQVRGGDRGESHGHLPAFSLEIHGQLREAVFPDAERVGEEGQVLLLV